MFLSLSLSLTHDSYFLGRGRGEEWLIVWWYTESSWRSRSNEVGECAWYVLSCFAFIYVEARGKKGGNRKANEKDDNRPAQERDESPFEYPRRRMDPQ